MSKLLAPIDRALSCAVGILMVVIVTTVSIDVIGRYVFHHSFLFSNELGRLCFIWLTFLVMPLGISKGMHVAITTLESHLSVTVLRALFRASTAAVIVLMVVVFIGAVVSIRGRWNEPLNTLPFSAAWFYVPLALGAVLSILHLINEFINGVRSARPVIDLG